LFESPPLEGVPDGEVELRFIRVEMPSQSQTSIHTHPGPEYIYVTEGEFEYQNALIGTKTMGPGDDAALPADTAVQKRNPRGPTAVFLSWFVVAAGEPFAPAAEFTGTTGT
jgi:quercetin dioxygenase-like cupin family protein